MTESPAKLTTRRVWKDLTWLLSIFLGTPSIVVLLQSTVFEHSLVDPIQYFIDAYQLLLEVLGALVEPYAQSTLDWFGERLGLHITLYEHWRPLFLLALIFEMPILKYYWNKDSLKERARHGYRILRTVGFGLVGSIAAATFPLDGSWWIQGLIAGVPVALYMFGLFLSVIRHIRLYILWYTFQSAFYFFMFAAALSFVPGFERGAGIVVIVFAILLISLVQVARNFKEIDIRLSLMRIGPFVGAALLYGTNWLVHGGNPNL